MSPSRTVCRSTYLSFIFSHCWSLGLINLFEWVANGIVLCIHHDDKKWPEFFNSFNKFTKQEDNHKRFRRLNGNKSHVSLSEEQYAVWLYFCCDYKKRMKPLSIIFFCCWYQCWADCLLYILERFCRCFISESVHFDCKVMSGIYEAALWMIYKCASAHNYDDT